MLLSIAYLPPTLNIPLDPIKNMTAVAIHTDLTGEQITLTASIFTAVNLYNFLTKNRLYHPNRAIENALKHNYTESNKHFDPEVMEVYLKVLDKKNHANFFIIGDEREYLNVKEAAKQ